MNVMLMRSLSGYKTDEQSVRLLTEGNFGWRSRPRSSKMTRRHIISDLADNQWPIPEFSQALLARRFTEVADCWELFPDPGLAVLPNDPL